jgi:hypothetical protein
MIGKEQGTLLISVATGHHGMCESRTATFWKATQNNGLLRVKVQ